MKHRTNDGTNDEGESRQVRREVVADRSPRVFVVEVP
jgi:hypothetical protein